MKNWNVFLRGHRISKVSFPVFNSDKSVKTADQIKDELVFSYGWHSKIALVEA